jgi:uncharacterized protein YbjT (DUF2867 family)
MPGRVLVVGATGLLGRPVAERLRADGFGVRILARDPERASTLLGNGYDVVRGDVEDADALRAALEGADGVHISLKAGPERGAPERVEHQGTARVAGLAKESGVKRITYLSGCFVDERHAQDSEAEAAKLGAEQAIESSGVAYTILRPTYFMETLALHVQGRVAVVLGKQPHPWHMIAASDFAGMVSGAHSSTAQSSANQFVFGPEPLTIAEALKRYCEAVEGGMRVLTVPLRLMKALNATVMRGALNRELALMTVMQREGEPTAPAADGAVQRGTTPFAQWLDERTS